MGVEPFLLSSSLLGVMAQRLVRILCEQCKQASTPNEAERAVLKLEPGEQITIHRAVGCEVCSGTGYRGRTGIYEMVEIGDEMRGMIHEGTSEQKMERYARTRTPGIREDGLKKVTEGVTTLEEVVRVTYAE
jgi:general secretion pathway protein E